MRRLASCAWALLWAAAAGHGTEHLEQLARARTYLNYTVRSVRGGRRLEAVNGDEWTPIRIHVDTSELERDVSPDELRYLRDDVLAAAVRWLKLALRVRPVLGNLQFEKHCDLINHFGTCAQVSVHAGQCGDATIPNAHFRDRRYCNTGLEIFCDVSEGGPGLPNADFALYVTAKDNSVCGAGAAAHGSTCVQDQADRPLAGNLNFCRYHLRRDRRWHATVATAVHEILHTLGFSSSMFAFFRADDGSPRTPRDEHGIPQHDGSNYQSASNTIEHVALHGGDKQYIVLPRVVEAARRHYACDTLRRVPLEDTGNDGTRFSHWDDHYLFSEVMTPDVNTMPRVSEMTLALLEDSGWYKADYSQAGGFFFGRHKGCAFLNEPCIKDGATRFPDTFCTANGGPCSGGGAAPGCAHDLMAKAYCSNCLHDQPLPRRFRYFNNSHLGGTRRQMSYCPSWEPWGNAFCQDDPSQHFRAYGEAYSADARCIMSTAIKEDYYTPSSDMASCRNVRCERGYVLVGVGQSWVNCSASEAGVRKAPGGRWSGEIVCPTYAQVCGRDGDEGPGRLRCRFPGVLRDGRCVCAPGYVNEDCAVEDTEASRSEYPYGLRYHQPELQLQAGVSLASAPGISSWPVGPSLASRPSARLFFAVSPPLPAGLSLAAEDGVLSGTPQGAIPRTAYVIRAAGGRGASTTTVFIAVSCAEGQEGCQVAAPAPPAPAPPAPAPLPPAPLPPDTSGEQSPAELWLVRVVLPSASFGAIQVDPGLQAFATQFASVVSAASGHSMAATRLLELRPTGVQADFRAPAGDGAAFAQIVERLEEAFEDSGSGLRSSAFAERYMEGAKLLTVTSEGIVQVWPELRQGETLWENIQRRWPLFLVLGGCLLLCLCCSCSCPGRCRRRKRGSPAQSVEGRAAPPAAVPAVTNAQCQPPRGAPTPVVIGVPLAAAAGEAAPKSALRRCTDHPTPPVVEAPAEAAQRGEAMTAMLEMGYDFDPSFRALEQSAWDVSRAVAALSAGQ